MTQMYLVVICSAVLLLVVLGFVGFTVFGAAVPSRPRLAATPVAAPLQARQPRESVAATLRQETKTAMDPRRAPERSPWTWRIAALIVVPLGCAVVAVLVLAGQVQLDPLEVIDSARRGHIQSTLNPEKLVPPPALPPAMFVVAERPALQSADRDWARLDPAFSQQVLQLFERMRKRGYEMALLEGYRSPERQDRLAALGPTVTNARAFQSKHQYGIAVDLAPVRAGTLVISERDPWAAEAYKVLGEETQAMGLKWGGAWWFRDLGHVESTQSIDAYLQSRSGHKKDAPASR